MTFNFPSHGIARRAAAAVATTAALLVSLLAGGFAPSASASEFHGAGDSSRATLSYPMLTGTLVSSQGTIKRVLVYGGLTITPAASSTPANRQRVSVTQMVYRQVGSTRSAVQTIRATHYLNQGSVLWLPRYSYYLGSAAAADYRVTYYVEWYDNVTNRPLDGGFIASTTASDYQCVNVPSICTVLVDGVHI